MFILIPFFFTATATTEIYTLSLHDALPIFHCIAALLSSVEVSQLWEGLTQGVAVGRVLLPLLAERQRAGQGQIFRSEEHTSELQSHVNLVCRLLLEKKKKKT